MECKASPNGKFFPGHAGIDLTRMECKGGYYGLQKAEERV